MEYCALGDLKSLIEKRKNNDGHVESNAYGIICGKYFSEHELLLMFSQICLAVEYVHEKEIIHRYH